MQSSPENPLFNDRPLCTAALGFALGIFFCNRLAGMGQFIVLCLFSVLLLAALLVKSKRAYLFICALLGGFLRLRLAIASVLPPLEVLLSSYIEKLSYVRLVLLRSTDALFYDLSPLFRAMLWGDKTLLAKAETSAFRVAGLSHVLALSGLHVGFFAGALLLLIPKSKPRLRFWIVSVFLFAYCGVAAFPASLVRAGVMTVCMLLSTLYYRPFDLPCSLGLSALLILLVSPASLFDVGFQLSFSAVAGIAMLAPIFRRSLHSLPVQAAQSLSVTAGATLGTMPLTLYHFQTLPLYSLLANLFLLPIIPLSLIPAFCAVLLGLISPAAAKIPAFVAYHCMLMVKSLSVMLASLPYASLTFEKPPSECFIILAYLGMLVVSPFPLRSRPWKLCALCVLLFLMLILSLCGILFP